MSTVAIITARGGSKRIPHKNIKDFMGKPMLAYAIQAALNSGIFDEVMVSTDSSEIADVAKKHGAQVPFMRSSETANDFATTSEVLSEVITQYKKQGKNFDTLCCIYPCVPFLTGNVLKQAYSIFHNTKCDTLVPVVKYSFPIQRAFKVKDGMFLEYREPENSQKRTQDLEPMFHDVGMFYFTKTNSFVASKLLVNGKVSYIEMDETQTQDIDTETDWKMAELKYKILLTEGKANDSKTL